MFNKKIIIDKMNRIRNKLHKTETSEVCKVPLPCFNDKRYILDDDINSFSYLHKDIWRK